MKVLLPSLTTVPSWATIRRKKMSMLRSAKLLQRSFTDRSIDIFFRRIVAQDGTVVNDGSKTFTPDQLLHMNWLCDNIVGSIPAYEELLPFSTAMVRELGIYRDEIPR